MRSILDVIVSVVGGVLCGGAWLLLCELPPCLVLPLLLREMRSVLRGGSWVRSASLFGLFLSFTPGDSNRE